MTEGYEFFDHTADLGVCVSGATLSELFTHAAQALTVAMGQLTTTDTGRERVLELQAGSVEDLLHDWLAELLFEIAAHHILYTPVVFVTIEPHRLTANMRGGQIDFARSRVNQEIKAVTYHRLQVEQLPDTTWRAVVVFDV